MGQTVGEPSDSGSLEDGGEQVVLWHCQAVQERGAIVMSADVLRECGILINTNLLLKRGTCDGEFRDFLRKIQQSGAQCYLGELIRRSRNIGSPYVRQTNSPPKYNLPLVRFEFKNTPLQKFVTSRAALVLNRRSYPILNP